MQLTNLSESGCFVAASEAVAVGTEVTLLVTVADTEIPVVGRVVRVQHGRGFAVEINEQWKTHLRDLFKPRD
jgi:Tfp pilus assembly protein PilZ